MNNQNTHFYDVAIEWTTEKKGTLTVEGLPTLEVASPPEFEGHPGIWTPEHLFVASLNSCFMATFLAIAKFSKLDFSSFKSHAKGKLEKVEGIGFQITEVVLRPQLVINQESDLEKAERILEKSKKNCLISNSVKSLVTLEPNVTMVSSN